MKKLLIGFLAFSSFSALAGGESLVIIKQGNRIAEIIGESPSTYSLAIARNGPISSENMRYKEVSKDSVWLQVQCKKGICFNDKVKHKNKKPGYVFDVEAVFENGTALVSIAPENHRGIGTRIWKIRKLEKL